VTGGLATDMLLSEFDYELPLELIAQQPLPDRAASRLLVLDRRAGDLHHSRITDLPSWLDAGDLLVANNSRVLPARVTARKETGGRVEFLFLRDLGDGCWSALARPVRKLRAGTHLTLEPRPGSSAVPEPVEVVAIVGEGEVTIRVPEALLAHLGDFGTLPLPPYIHEMLEDPERYQTVYASVLGSAAAPTAGLHLTPSLIEELTGAGVGWAEVTLHIGLDTFRPVTVERVEDHHIHQEWCQVSDAVAQRIAETKAAGGRVIAVGTTAARTLETLGRQWKPARPAGMTGPTDLFIRPGYTWRVVDALLTNFHLPKSTLLMMVSALADREFILRAYRDAIAHRYRFFSFGDAMLII
jgi:S-adenosylmethionine:tRNA ribosyltransferase-isomerase